jgi:hypothetical protein
MVRNARAYATSRTCYAFRVLERAERRGTLWPRGSYDSVAARGQERARGSITLMERSSTCGSTLGHVGREVDCDTAPGTLEQFQVLQVLTRGVQTCHGRDDGSRLTSSTSLHPREQQPQIC